jgi:hypothetical protein
MGDPDHFRSALDHCAIGTGERFNEIEHIKFTEADLVKYRNIPLSAITDDPEGLAKVMIRLVAYTHNSRLWAPGTARR